MSVPDPLGWLPSREAIRAEIQRRREEAARQAAQRKLFGSYHDEPGRFIRECFLWGAGEGPVPYQADAADDLVRYRRECWRSPHAAGKTSLAAWLVHWFALTREMAQQPWKIATTASTWRQLEHYLWPEIHKWAKQINWIRVGREPYRIGQELLTMQLKLHYGSAFAVASDDPRTMEGAHEDQLLFIFDEAKIIPDPHWDAVEGAFAGMGETYALAISTPGEPAGRFYQIQSKKDGYEDWHVRHVTMEEMVAVHRQNPAWVEQRRRQWGERSAVFQNRVLGNFAAQEATGVIPLSWVEAAHERWRAWKLAREQDPETPVPLTTIGFDVARSGEDDSVAAMRSGWTITEFRYPMDKTDTMSSVGLLVSVLQHARSAKAIVDVIGLGAGVVDRLRELGFLVMGFNAQAKALIGDDPAMDRTGEFGFVNLRSAAWWYMRELLDPINQIPIALPPPGEPGGDELLGELTAPRFRMVSGGKIEVEGKDRLIQAEGEAQSNKQTLRQRLGRSTDHADAVIQAFADKFAEGGLPPAMMWGGVPPAA